jgi:hypothetical protein
LAVAGKSGRCAEADVATPQSDMPGRHFDPLACVRKGLRLQLSSMLVTLLIGVAATDNPKKMQRCPVRSLHVFFEGKTLKNHPDAEFIS